jgi:hypothetical protein
VKLLPPDFTSDVPALFLSDRNVKVSSHECSPGQSMRILIVSGVLLVVAALVLQGRRRNRPRTAPQAGRNATERWEDEGGALRGRPV